MNGEHEVKINRNEQDLRDLSGKVDDMNTKLTTAATEMRNQKSVIDRMNTQVAELHSLFLGEQKTRSSTIRKTLIGLTVAGVSAGLTWLFGGGA